MDYARLKDFTLKNMNIRVVLDARMSPTLSLSLTTTNALFCMTRLSLFGAGYCASTEKPSSP